jgi:hypothetical protein
MTQSNSDLSMVAPTASESAAAVSPKAAAAPFAEPAFTPPAPRLAGLASAGSALSFDAEVDAFMAWLEEHDAVPLMRRNASTFAVAAANEIISNSTSVSRA